MFVKKNLIAVAALAALAVSAHAQSSVTLYGNVDVSGAYVKNKQGGESQSTTAVESSILTESYLGLKGVEDLGGGLKAMFKLESSLAVDTGNANTTFYDLNEDDKPDAKNFWDKNALVGLSGDFGTVTLGNQESLFKLQAAAFNPFGTSRLLATSQLLLTASGLGGSWQNTVGYTSSSLGGLTVSAQHSAKEGGRGDATKYNGGATAVAANYGVGPLALSAVYGDVRSTDATAQDTRQKAYLLGASYDFGVVKAFAQYGRDKFQQKGVPGDDTAKFFQLGAVVPVTQAGTVHAAFGQVKDEESKIRQFSLAYNHSLTKRSGVYAGLTYIKDEINGEADGKTTALAVGLRHAF